MIRYVLAALSIAVATPALPQTPPQPAAVAAALSALRAEAHAGPLTDLPAANKVARGLARDMARSGRAWAYAPDGRSPWRRLGLTQPDPVLIGIITLESYDDWPTLMQDCLSRPNTRALLLDRGATRLGFGAVTDSRGKHWVALWLFR